MPCPCDGPAGTARKSWWLTLPVCGKAPRRSVAHRRASCRSQRLRPAIWVSGATERRCQLNNRVRDELDAAHPGQTLVDALIFAPYCSQGRGDEA